MRSLLILRPCKSSNGHYRLGLFVEDYNRLVSGQNVQSLTVNLDGNTIDLRRSLRTYRRHGSLSNSQIAQWISSNNAKNPCFHYLFELEANDHSHAYRYIGSEKEIVKLFVNKW